MYTPVRYNALIIDPDLDTRMRLKAATTSVVQFGKVQLVTSITEATRRLEAGEACDVMFLSYRFERADIGTFIKNAKETKAAQDAAYVLVLQTSEQDSQTVAENVMIGADGLLFEPYSVDYLVEITELAARVKKERGAAREAAALKFLLTDVMHQIDLIAYLKSVGYDVGRGIRRFKQMCGVFNTLEKDSLEVYYDLAVDMFSEAPFPKKIYQKNYKGASSRVKKKMEQKLLAELEKDLLDEEDDAVGADAAGAAPTKEA
ncbi:hypothetical protein OAO01_01255 [Oligoflexia bacterium]|nr:hypothetical protein [Oligoflexia bacterium]